MTWFAKWKKIRAYKKVIKPILKGRSKSLRTKCKEAADLHSGIIVAGKLESVILKINDTAKGMPRKYIRCAGLAANQIGIDARVFVVAKSGGGFRRYVNPRILKKSEVMIEREEICFSHKGTIKVMRAKAVTVKSDGMVKPKTLTGIEAWAFQHEFDHLEGIIHK